MRVMSTEGAMGGTSRKTLLEIEPMRAPQGQSVMLARTEPALPPARDAREVSDARGTPDTPKRGWSRRGLIFLIVGAVILAVAGYYGYNWWTNGRFIVSTDDAYVAANSATIAPKVAG